MFFPSILLSPFVVQLGFFPDVQRKEVVVNVCVWLEGWVRLNCLRCWCWQKVTLRKKKVISVKEIKFFEKIEWRCWLLRSFNFIIFVLFPHCISFFFHFFHFLHSLNISFPFTVMENYLQNTLPLNFGYSGLLLLLEEDLNVELKKAFFIKAVYFLMHSDLSAR